MNSMLVAAGLLALLGSAESAPAPEHVPAPPARLAPGTWHVEGEDTIPWTAELTLLEEANAGWFDWRSARGDQGRELVTWNYDPATGTLRLTGHKVLGARGNITFGNYQARLVAGGRRLVDGTWWGPPCMPGEWEATR
jgi:hypothetical protein